MRVLIIKTSSMGDVIHTLPAITDASRAIPGISFDWVVEENFAEIPRWHPLVNQIIPVAIRRWRKNLFSKKTWIEVGQFLKQLRAREYDLVLDAQGLLKSAVLSYFARGKINGFDRRSAREGIATLFYRNQFAVEKKQHAIGRLRDLFSQVLEYVRPDSVPDYGVDRAIFYRERVQEPYLVFLHGTTWATKHWPEAYWIQLARLAADKQLKVKLLWGNEAEKKRAGQIAQTGAHIEVLPRLRLVEIAGVLANAKAVVAVDTGLGHLTAALAVPMVSLYGPTNPLLTGALGKNQIHLAAEFVCAPCLGRVCSYRSPAPLEPPCFVEKMPPQRVWAAVVGVL